MTESFLVMFLIEYVPINILTLRLCSLHLKILEKNAVPRCFIIVLSAISTCQILAVISLSLSDPLSTPRFTLVI